MSLSQSFRSGNRSLRVTTAGALLALFAVSCGTDSAGDVATTIQPPGSSTDLDALVTRVCEDLSEGLLSYAVVIEDAVIQAADLSFSGKELGEALMEECPEKVPHTELLGTE